MKFVYSALAAYALALSAAQALTIDASDVAPPADVVGEHQSLQKTWTITSLEELEKLVLLVPGRVFIDVAGSVATPAPSTVAPTPVPTPKATKPAVVVVPHSDKSDDDDDDARHSTSTSGSRDDSADTVVVVVPLRDASASRDNASDSDDNDTVVFPKTTVAATRPLAVSMTHKPSNATQTNMTHAPSAAAAAAKHSDSHSAEAAGLSVANRTTTLRRALKHDDDDSSDDDSRDDDSRDDKKHSKHTKPQETVVATVVITGNSSALLDLIEIVPLHARSQNGIKIHLKNQDAALSGFVLTQITVASTHVVRSVAAHFADAVVIGDRVLVTDDADATLRLSTAGDSSLFVHATSAVSLDALKLDVAGTGLVQLDVPALTLADTLVVDVAGAGTVALLANASLTTAELTAAVSGSGDLIVQTAQLVADTLTAAVYGDGSASFASAGSVRNEKLTLSGAGSLLVGSLVAQDAAVSIWGTGDVIVRVTDKLKVATTFTGSVAYVGAPPKRIKTSKWLFWRSDIVHPAVINTVLTHAVVAAPARYPAQVSIVTTRRHDADEPRVVVGTPAQLSYFAVVSTHLASVAHGPNGFVVLSMVAVVVVVAGVAAKSVYTRRVRRHYRPLV